jgi:ATP-binding cassette subfamily B protein
MMPGEKARDFKTSMGRLIAYMGKYKWLIFVILLVAAASSVFSIFGPRILGSATTELFAGVRRIVQGDPLGVDFEKIGEILARVIVLYGLAALFGLVQGQVMSLISSDIIYRLRNQLSEKLHRLPLSFYDGVTQGEVLSRVTNDVDTIGTTLNQSLSQIITSVTTVIGVLVMMLTINVTLTLVGLTIVPMTLIMIRLVVSRSQGYFRKQQAYLGHINGHVEEMYGAHVVLKTNNGEESSIAHFETLNKEFYTSAWRAQFISNIMMPLMRLFSNLGYVAVAMVGGYLMVQGRLNLGDIQAFIQYLNSFTGPMMIIANISNVLQQTAAASERVFAFLDEKEEIPSPENPTVLEKVTGHVEFKDICFGYDPEEPVLSNFSLDVKPGQQIAIVGPTGAGKTTLVKLLMRFYELGCGEILVDGVNIQTMTREDLRSKFAMVLQDTWLFNGSIMENIRYGRQDATDEEVMRAADMAYADHFTRTLPGGYSFEINEDATNVSAGQKQLLTIARAVLKDAPILILDEATSSVDTRTELLIQKAMTKLMCGRTSFVIAHRLSTIKNADRILVLRDGNIVEIGTHDELLARQGFYAELYYSQFVKQAE